MTYIKKYIYIYIGDRQEARRHASVLVLAELVRNADVIVYPFVGSILDHIWVAFRDPNVRYLDGQKGRTTIDLFTAFVSYLAISRSIVSL